MKIFTPIDIAKMPANEVKEAFQHLKSVANKRIGRMQAQGLGRPMQKFGSMRGMSEEQMRQGLAEVSRWIREPSHTVRGYKSRRSEMLDAFHEKGYDFVNEELLLHSVLCGSSFLLLTHTGRESVTRMNGYRKIVK